MGFTLLPDFTQWCSDWAACVASPTPTQASSNCSLPWPDASLVGGHPDWPWPRFAWTAAFNQTCILLPASSCSWQNFALFQIVWQAKHLSLGSFILRNVHQSALGIGFLEGYTYLLCICASRTFRCSQVATFQILAAASILILRKLVMNICALRYIRSDSSTIV